MAKEANIEFYFCHLRAPHLPVHKGKEQLPQLPLKTGEERREPRYFKDVAGQPESVFPGNL